mmetsp:Transcript_11451/g.29489  ORF Transcript_11451/g.29489 Transcript_11451/m.29489 type:complete len:375 (-) Transcript_11451:108-1232(-)
MRQHLLQALPLGSGLVALRRLAGHELLPGGQVLPQRGELHLKLADLALVLEPQELQLLMLLAQLRGLLPLALQLSLGALLALLQGLAAAHEALALLLELLRLALRLRRPRRGLIQAMPEIRLYSCALLGSRALRIREEPRVLLPQLRQLPLVGGLERLLQVRALLCHHARAGAELVGLVARLAQGLVAGAQPLGQLGALGAASTEAAREVTLHGLVCSLPQPQRDVRKLAELVGLNDAEEALATTAALQPRYSPQGRALGGVLSLRAAAQQLGKLQGEGLEVDEEVLLRLEHVEVTLPQHEAVVEEEVSLVRELQEQAPGVGRVVGLQPHRQPGHVLIAAGGLHLHGDHLQEEGRGVIVKARPHHVEGAPHPSA